MNNFTLPYHLMDTNHKIEKVIEVIKTCDLDQIKLAVNQYGHCVNKYYTNGHYFQLDPILYAAIETRQIEIVKYFFQWYVDDPNERDMIIGVAIKSGHPEIVRLVIDHVSTVEAWEFVIGARYNDNPDIITMVEEWAGDYHIKLADDFSSLRN